MSREFPEIIDDSSAEALWRMYAKAKASLPYKERMQNLTWRMMGMNRVKNNTYTKNTEISYPQTSNTFDPGSHAAFNTHIANDHLASNIYSPPSNMNFSVTSQSGNTVGGDEYLNFGDANHSLLKTDKPKVTSNLTKFFLGQQQNQQQAASFTEGPSKIASSANDPTSDDFDYVAHIKKIGQEDSNVPQHDDAGFKGIRGVPIHSNPTDIPFSHSHNTEDAFNFNSVSSSFNNNHSESLSHKATASVSIEGHGGFNAFGSGYLDSPNHESNSYMDPLDAISSSYDTPSNFNHASSSFNDTPSYFQSVYSQSLHSPASSAAQTPSLDNGSFFEGYYNGATARNSMSFASQLRTVPSSTSFANLQNSMENPRGSVKQEISSDVIMADSTTVAGSSQPNLSSSFNSRRPSTASTIKKKSTTSKLTKSKRSSSSTQLATSAPVVQMTPSITTNLKKPEIPTSSSNTRCTNCNTQTTPLWRRNPEGQPLCNACGLFLKLHGVVRPLSLKTDVIKKRQRGGSTVSKSGSTQPSSPSKSSSTTLPSTTKKTQQTKGNDDKKKAGSSSASSRKKPDTQVPDASFLQDIQHNNLEAGFSFDDKSNQSPFQFNNAMDVDNDDESDNATGGTQPSQHHGEGIQNNPNNGNSNNNNNNNWEWLTMAL